MNDHETYPIENSLLKSRILVDYTKGDEKRIGKNKRGMIKSKRKSAPRMHITQWKIPKGAKY